MYGSYEAMANMPIFPVYVVKGRYLPRRFQSSKTSAGWNSTLPITQKMPTTQKPPRQLMDIAETKISRPAITSLTETHGTSNFGASIAQAPVS